MTALKKVIEERDRKEEAECIVLNAYMKSEAFKNTVKFVSDLLRGGL